jgi:hypothetical protein
LLPHRLLRLSGLTKRLVADWNERQSKHMPLLFSPTIEAALPTNHYFLCPACRITAAVDLRRLDRHRRAAVTSRTDCRPCAAVKDEYRGRDAR